MSSAEHYGVYVSIEDMILDVDAGHGKNEIPPDSILYKIAAEEMAKKYTTDTI